MAGIAIICVGISACDSAETVQRTADRILNARGYREVVLDTRPGKADIWCPQGLSSVAWSAKSKGDNQIHGAVCSKGDVGYVVVFE